MVDVLSRDTHLMGQELTNLLIHSIPEQVPPNFDICPLPPTVSSWLISLLRSPPLIEASKKVPTRSTTWLGRDGRDGSSRSSSSTTTTWRHSSLEPGPDSSALLPRQSEQLDFQDQLIASLLPGQYPIPSTMWERPLWTPVSPTPVTPQPGPLLDFYSASTRITET